MQRPEVKLRKSFPPNISGLDHFQELLACSRPSCAVVPSAAATWSENQTWTALTPVVFSAELSERTGSGQKKLGHLTDQSVAGNEVGKTPELSPLMPTCLAIPASSTRLRIDSELYHLVDEAYQRRDWETLGYRSWKQYVDEELGISEQRSYQLLDQVKVERALEQAATSTQPRLSPDGDEYRNVGMTEREARRMKPQLPDAVGWLLDQMATTTESVKKGSGLCPI